MRYWYLTKSFQILWTFVELVTNFEVENVVVTKSNDLLKCTLLVHLRKQNVPLCHDHF